jgi:hypothetical protein
VNEWLDQARDRIAAATGESPDSLALDQEQIDEILEIARIAAHESGERTNAPLVCYLAGLAAGRGSAEPEDVIEAASGAQP